MLEGDRRHRLSVAIAPAQLALHVFQPFDGFRRGGAVAVGVGQIPAARIRRVFRVFGDRLPSVAVTRVCRVGVIARIDHHHAHCDTPRTVGRFDRQRERARFERQRRRAGDGIHTAGKLAVKIVLFVGEDTALEIMVAVRRSEGDARFQRRPQKRGERVAHFLPCLVEQRRRGDAIDGFRPRFQLAGRTVATCAFHQFRRIGADAVDHPPFVGGLRFGQCFGDRMTFDAADFRFDFGDRAHVRTGLFATATQKRIDICRIVAADLIAGEHDEVGMCLLDGGFDQPNRVFAHVRTILNISHLQHPERTVAVESQAHDAHCTAANLDMG